MELEKVTAEIRPRTQWEAVDLGIKHVWMQPGAESAKAVALGRENGINVVANGPCVLVVLGYRER